jgi:hypothetical protein
MGFTQVEEAAFNALVSNLRTLFDSKAEKAFVREDVLIPLTDQQLNLQYPDAGVGTQVICPYITGGGELYEKFNDVSNAWFRLYMTKGTSSTSPGVMQDLEIVNFV